MFNFFTIIRNRIFQIIEDLGGLLFHDGIGTVYYRLYCRNLGVSYILKCLREVDAEVKKVIVCFWTVIPRFTFFTV